MPTCQDVLGISPKMETPSGIQKIFSQEEENWVETMSENVDSYLIKQNENSLT